MPYHHDMAYTGWPTNVNKLILDSTSVTVGEGAVITDSLETGGQKKSRLARANPSDKYQVTMTFSFDEESKDENGQTELDRFWSWLKWKHCYGTNPFKFPAILLNSNRQRGWSQEERGYIANQMNNQGLDVTPDDIPDYEYYCITSAAEGTKSGTHCQITMTWETYATGVISVPDETATVDDISATNGYVDVFFTETPQTEPDNNSFTLYIDDVETATTAYVFDGDVTLRLFFEPLTPDPQTVTHTAKILNKTSRFDVL